MDCFGVLGWMDALELNGCAGGGCAAPDVQSHVGSVFGNDLVETGSSVVRHCGGFERMFLGEFGVLLGVQEA